MRRTGYFFINLFLGFAQSNYVTERNEQRWRRGKIKVKDLDSKRPIDELSVSNSDFLIIFVMKE